MNVTEDVSIMVIFKSFITIFLIYQIVISKNVLRRYLRLKSPNKEVKILIDNIFKKNKFNELINIWIGYRHTTYLLKFHFYLLLTGLFFAIAYPFMDFESFKLSLIVLLISGIAICTTLSKLNGDVIIIYNMSMENKYEILRLFIFSSLIPSLPLCLVLILLLINNFDLSLSAQILIYLSLTFGLYEYIKRFIGFFLPIPTAGEIYSTEDLIQEIMSAKEGKANIMKEIVDDVSK